MTCIETSVAAQAMLSGADALVLAREQFPNLCCAGILPKPTVGTPVDLDDVEVAMEFFRQCRKTKRPTVHTFDLRRVIGVQLGAVIAAATALGFGVHSWFGVTTFVPHAMICVNKFDVRKLQHGGQ